MPSAPAARSSSWPQAAARLLPVLVLAAIAFSPALRGEFLDEDGVLLSRSTAEAVSARPLEAAVLALTNQIAPARPIAFHLVSLCVHLGATAALYVLALRLAQRSSVAVAAAALFGLHPVHAECVARIGALHAPLAAACVLFALCALERAARRESLDWTGHAVAAALFVCGLLADDIAIAFVPMAMTLEFCVARRVRLGRYAIFAACAIAWFALRPTLVDAAPLGAGGGRLAELRIEVFGQTLRQLFWPFANDIVYPYRPAIDWNDATLLLGVSAIALWIGVTVWLYRTNRRVALAALLLVLAALLQPAVMVHAAGTFPITPEQLYLPAAGFALLLALAATSKFGVAFTALLALAFGAQSYARVQLWRSDLVLATAAVAEHPSSPALQWRLGKAQLREYTERGDFEQLHAAGRTFQSALDLLTRTQKGDRSIFATSNDFLQSNLGLGWSLLFQSEHESYGADDTAHRVFQMVAGRYVGSVEAQTALGVSALALGRLDESERAFEKALSLRPGYAEALHNLGELRVRRKDWPGAIDAFEQALKARPDHLDDLVSLAGALAESGEEARAIETADRAAALAPRSPRPLVIRGTIEAQRGAFDSALTWADRALALAPDDGEALLLRGKILLARGELFGARTAFTRAADRLPRSFEAHYNLAALYLKSDDRAAALPHLLAAYAAAADDNLRRTLSDIGIQSADTYWRLASIDADRGQAEAAESWLGRALELDPDHGASHLLLGIVRKQRGNIDGAISALEHACRSMPESYAAHYTLGTMLVDAGRAKEGLVYLERALAIVSHSEGQNPESAAALEGLRQRIDEIQSKSQ